MSTVINTNLASLFAQNSLANAQNNLATSVQRLSSGLRINSAKDDAAGLAISQNMQSQINGTNQSVRNLNDATNLLQTADTSLSTIHDMLLRLKQLSTQGYDGSLSANQKLNIVQEMKDLNAEINATAQRTQFNGINLLTSGSTVDLNNSDIRSGVALNTTAVAVTTGSGLGAKIATGFDDSDSAGGNVDTAIRIQLDPNLAPKIPGNYTITSNGANLTLTGTFNGLAQSQTVVVADAVANDVAGGARTTDQSLNFDTFGITLNLSSVRKAGSTLLGSTIATNIAATTTLSVAGQGSEITDVRLSGVAPGSYNLTYTAGDGTEGYVQMSGEVNGIATTQQVWLSDGVANTTQTLNFSAFGAQIDIKSYQDHGAAFIGEELITLDGGAPTADGQLVVSSGANSALKFQSGPSSDAFIQIDTLNVQTGTTGTNAGQASEMMTLGTRITGSAAGNLGTLGSTNTIEQWQTAFKNAAAAVDNAIEYISNKRATFGSQMNRLSYISTNLQAQSTNLQQSRSAMMDTDFAAETAKLTKGQIMQQAATAMLAQANQMPNVILSLLK